MSSLNQVNLIGRVGRDPELKYLQSGEAVTAVSLATSERWKDKNSGEMKELTEWHRCTFFGKLAETVGSYVKKGSLLYVRGSIRSRKFTPQGGGEEKTIYEIKGEQMQMIGPRQDGGGSSPAPAPAARPAAAPRQAPKGGGDMDDDIPF